MIEFKSDSIKELNERELAEAQKDKQLKEQAQNIELLKGCIMELTGLVLGGEA